MAVMFRSRAGQCLRCGLSTRPSRKAILGRVLLTVVLMGNALMLEAVVEERGGISGIIQLHGQGLPEHRIMLIRFGPEGEVHRTPGQTDTTGQFTFDNLEPGETFEYFVGIRYEGQLYRSAPIRLAAGQQRTGVVLELGTPPAQTTKDAGDPPSLLAANHLVVVVMRDQNLEVREVVRVLNTQEDSYPQASAPPGSARNFLHLPLPQGYRDFMVIQGLSPEHVRLVPSGLHYIAPLAAGEHRLIYTYSLPLRTDLVTLVLERTLPTTILDVLVEDSHLVANSDQQFMGRVSIEPHTFWHFRGMNLALHARSWLQVTRRNAPAPFLHVGAYSVITGIILLGIGLPFYHAWRWRVQPGQGGVENSRQEDDLNVSRLRLLQSIASLDDQHQAGTLEANVYQQRRSAYKKQLRALVQHLRHVPPDKDMN